MTPYAHRSDKIQEFAPNVMLQDGQPVLRRQPGDVITEVWHSSQRNGERYLVYLVKTLALLVVVETRHKEYRQRVWGLPVIVWYLRRNSIKSCSFRIFTKLTFILKADL